MANHIFTLKSEWSRIFSLFKEVVYVSSKKCLSPFALPLSWKTPQCTGRWGVQDLDCSSNKSGLGKFSGISATADRPGHILKILTLCGYCGGWSWTGKCLRLVTMSTGKEPSLTFWFQIFLQSVWGTKVVILCSYWECVLGQDIRNPDLDQVIFLQYSLLRLEYNFLISPPPQYCTFLCALSFTGLEFMYFFFKYRHFVQFDTHQRLSFWLWFFERNQGCICHIWKSRSLCSAN